MLKEIDYIRYMLQEFNSNVELKDNNIVININYNNFSNIKRLIKKIKEWKISEKKIKDFLEENNLTESYYFNTLKDITLNDKTNIEKIEKINKDKLDRLTNLPSVITVIPKEILETGNIVYVIYFYSGEKIVVI